ERDVLGKPLLGQLPRRGQDRERDREVEARSDLPELRRREIDRDPEPWPFELSRRDPAADALLRLLARAVGEADDRERRHRALEVRLDLDPAGLEADEAVGDRSCKHGLDGTDENVTCL